MGAKRKMRSTALQVIHKVSNTSLTAKMDSGKHSNTKTKAVPVGNSSQKPYDLKPKPYFPVAQRMVPDDARIAVIGQADPNEHIEDRLIEENFQSDEVKQIGRTAIYKGALIKNRRFSHFYASRLLRFIQLS